jgi:AcrR family transcriptional regulator
MLGEAIPTGGLRERKHRRTRETIVRVALQLFSEQGYRATTLPQVAAAAEIAPSTLHTYFASKEDIVFGPHEAVRESVTTRIRDRPQSETLNDALRVWTSEVLPTLLSSESETAYRERRTAIDSDETLQAAERLRLARLEDTFAEAYADDLGETAHDLRARLMASLATNGLNTIWQWWYPRLAHGQLDLNQLATLDATYLVSVLDAAEQLLKTIPTPPAHLATKPRD